MKILLISSLFGILDGGAGNLVQNLARGLAHYGHEIRIVTTRTGSDLDILNIDNIKVYHLNPANIFSIHQKDSHSILKKVIFQLIDIFNPLTYFKLKEIILQEKPDIIHIHKMRGFSSSVWYTAKKHHKGKVIQTCHDYESISPVGLLNGKIGDWVKQKRWPFSCYQKIRGFFAKGVDIVTAPSNFALEIIRESKVFQRSILVTIPNFHTVNQNRFESTNHFQEINSNYPGEFNILFFGRLEHEKGLLILCEVFEQIVKINNNVVLNICGNGSLQTKILEISKTSQNIIYHGLVQGEKKEKILSKSDLLIMPSLIEEVFGISIIEGYAFGLPVIATNMGGMREIVKDGETGWLIPANNKIALYNQICEVLGKQDLLPKISLNCKDFSSNFSEEKIISYYLELYNS